MFFLPLLSLFLGFQIPQGVTPWVEGKEKQSRVRIIQEQIAFEQGAGTQELRMGVEFELAPDWHVYWKNPGPVGFPPKVISSGWPSGWTSNLLFPAPERIKTETGYEAFGYSNQVIYPLILRGPIDGQSSLVFPIQVDYLVCKIQCIPESAAWTVTIPAAPKERLSRFASQIDRAVRLAPHSTSGGAEIRWLSERAFQISFSKNGPQMKDLFIAHSGANQKPVRNVKVVKTVAGFEIRSENEKPLPSLEWTAVYAVSEGLTGISGSVDAPSAPTIPWMTFLWALLFAFIGGAILNLMPCVLPVLALKTVNLLQLPKNQIHVLRRSLLLTTLGVLTSFLTLSLFILLLKNLGEEVGWGFQFQSPAFVAFMILVIFLFALNLFGIFEFQISSKAATAMSKTQKPFFEGVFATLLATPCSAPFLGTALTFALTQPPLILIATFLFMGLGLALPYLLISAYPPALKLLPKPGAWMDRLKRLLGYSLLITALWLLYVLQQQASVLIWMSVLVGLIFVFIVLREFKSSTRWIFLSLIVTFLLAFIARAPNPIGGSQSATGTTESGEWIRSGFSESLISDRVQAGETLFVVITADWCLTCKFNESTIIHTEWFQAKLKEQGVKLVTIDWTRRDDSIARFLKKYDRVAIPFSMLISKDKYLVLPELLTRGVVDQSWQKFF